MRPVLLSILAFGLLAGPAFAQGAAQAPMTAPMSHEPPPANATGSLVNQQGGEIGAVTLWETPHGVIIRIAASGLPAGELAVHLHETGACDPASRFESAGGHFNPADAEHGLLAEAGPHAGDMPNQMVGADGVLAATLYNTMVSLGSAGEAGERASLFDEDGTALMIHAHADDYLSQPAGDAGDRLACAVIGAVR
jgi:Cu-Zn family superoxide dismutase